MFYAERGLTGQGGGFQAVATTATEGDLISGEVEHGYEVTGSAGGFRAISREGRFNRPGAVARLVLCLFARGVTLRRIGVVGFCAGITAGGTFKL